jgi:hypothetical protein
MKMLGKTGQPPCGRCCGPHGKAHVRRMKRRERKVWKRECGR